MSDPITIAGAAGGALSALQYVNDFKQRAGQLAANMDAPGGDADSLVSYTKPARAEPITLVDTRATSLPYVKDVLQALTSIYGGYYLQAVSLAVGVGRINAIKMLDQFNPERSGPKADASYLLEKSLGELAGRSHFFNTESYKYGLPHSRSFGLEAYREALKDNPDAQKLLSVAIESDQTDELEATQAEGGKKPDTRTDFSPGKGNVQDIHEVPSLAVGKMLEVMIQSDGAKATFPVAVRLIVSAVDPVSLVHILGDGVKDSSTKERWHAWRSGAIGLADMLFAVDAIDAHRATLMKDKSGTYAEIQRRRRNNGLTTLHSGIADPTTKTSIGTASNLVVITEETVKELERHAGIRFSNAAQRKAVFDQSYLMIIAVVDPEWEHITFYTRGIALPTQLSVKQIQQSNKGSGPDVMEIMKALMLGKAPSI